MARTPDALDRVLRLLAAHGIFEREAVAYLQNRPDEAEIFGQAMTAKAGADIASVLDAYDFSRFGTIAEAPFRSARS